MRNHKIDSVLTAREAARRLHVHVNTVRRWSRRGILKSYRIGPRGDRRFKLEDIDALLLQENEMVTVSNESD